MDLRDIANRLVPVALIGGAVGYGIYNWESEPQRETSIISPRPTDEYNPLVTSTPSPPPARTTEGIWWNSSMEQTVTRLPLTRTSQPELPQSLGAGRVTFFRDEHSPHYELINIRTAPIQRVFTVGLKHFVMLEELLQRSPTDVWIESYSRDFTPSDLLNYNGPDPVHRGSPDQPLDSFGVIRRAFENGIGHNPTEIQLRFLFLYGPGLIYALMRPSVTIHKTITPQETELIRQQDHTLSLRVIQDVPNRLRARLARGETVRTGTYNVDPRDYFTPDERTTFDNWAHRDRNRYCVRELGTLLNAPSSVNGVVIYGGHHDLAGAAREAHANFGMESVQWNIPGTPLVEIIPHHP